MMRGFLLCLSFSPIFLSLMNIDLVEEKQEIQQVGNELLFVSLGSHCEPAMKLRDLKLREAAFPFDWFLSYSHQGLIDLLDENFEYFLDEAYLVRGLKDPYLVKNTRYHIDFTHEWSFPDYWIDLERSEDQMIQIRSKLSRRINRFRNLNQVQRKVVFIRTAQDSLNPITEIQAIGLRDALNRFFPALDYLLLIVNYRMEDNEDAHPFNPSLDRIFELRARCPLFPNKPEDTAEDYQQIFEWLKIYSSSR